MLDDQRLRDKFEKDLNDMEGMIRATWDFMRGAEQYESVQPVDIMDLLESLKADAQDMGREVNIVGTALLSYSGKPMALKRCISNLIDKAIQYGQRATIEIREGADQLMLVIRGQGPGIPDAQLEQVFEPFYRLESSRSRDSGGTGLGLSIARNIAQAHGGRLTLKNASTVELEAMLTLPRQ
ncbi:Putative two-component sensor histidine kinase (fragment) [Candidatus Methylobacter favarea]|uniref:histidine kinase n=1 Tax=Candidatus Methylobacter favarea TaxID=2707345 RepID=A0A8S0YB01_9GAMM